MSKHTHQAPSECFPMLLMCFWKQLFSVHGLCSQTKHWLMLKLTKQNTTLQRTCRWFRIILLINCRCVKDDGQTLQRTKVRTAFLVAWLVRTLNICHLAALLLTKFDETFRVGRGKLSAGRKSWGSEKLFIGNNVQVACLFLACSVWYATISTVSFA